MNDQIVNKQANKQTNKQWNYLNPAKWTTESTNSQPPLPKKKKKKKKKEKKKKKKGLPLHSTNLQAHFDLCCTDKCIRIKVVHIIPTGPVKSRQDINSADPVSKSCFCVTFAFENLHRDSAHCIILSKLHVHLNRCWILYILHNPSTSVQVHK